MNGKYAAEVETKCILGENYAAVQNRINETVKK